MDFQYFTSLPAIRAQARKVYNAAKEDKLSNFDFHPDKLNEVADYVTQTILNRYSILSLDGIPPHGRWQHFDLGQTSRLDEFIDKCTENDNADREVCRRLIDLFFVSVLLDAGAGSTWKYTLQPGIQIPRSEGIAHASLDMFARGDFGAEDVVTASGLRQLSRDTLVKGMQVSDTNPMTGIDGRLDILQKLGASLESNSNVFGSPARPGNIVDHLLPSDSDSEGYSRRKLDVQALWFTLQNLLLPIWPKDRSCIDGKPLGDVWPLSTLGDPSPSTPYSNLQPFHKLTQWLAYSLMVPFQRVFEVQWYNTHLLTGLPEYRNGGLFVDMGVLSLKADVLARGKAASGQDLPLFKTDDDVVVEWRAMTVVLLDEMLGLVNSRLKEKGAQREITLPQLLEAGTWKAGRLIAASHRPETGSSPILIESDGTLF